MSNYSNGKIIKKLKKDFAYSSNYYKLYPNIVKLKKYDIVNVSYFIFSGYSFKIISFFGYVVHSKKRKFDHMLKICKNVKGLSMHYNMYLSSPNLYDIIIY